MLNLRPSSRSVKGRLLATAVVALLSLPFVPASAAGSASIACLMGYGVANSSGAWCVQGFVGTVTPTSQPDSHDARGLLYVQGYATPDSWIAVAATDGVQTFSAKVTSGPNIAAPSDPPVGRFSARMLVTDLGTHVVAPGATPDTLDDSQLGRSVLTLTARVTDAAGIPTSPEARTTFIKLAGSQHDVTAPAISNTQTPSGGTLCGPIAQLYTEIRRQYIDRRYETCAMPLQVVSGKANDNSSAANGYASEIATVRVTMTQGTTILKDLNSLIRLNGTTASWYYSWPLQNFAPTDECINGTSYNSLAPAYAVKVSVTDAWSHETVTTSTFKVCSDL